MPNLGATLAVDSNLDSSFHRGSALRVVGGVQLAADRLREENSALRTEIAALRAMVYRDEATGLWNRHYFEVRFGEELSRIRRSSGRCLSLLFIDVNNLKQINDQAGHAMGDELIQRAAQFIHDNVRLHDVCCRWGGDEFMVILPDTDAKGCRKLVNRLRASLERANARNDIPLGLSIGASSWPDLVSDVDDLMSAADAAMYEDKRRQRTCRNMCQDLPDVGRDLGSSAVEP